MMEFAVALVGILATTQGGVVGWRLGASRLIATIAQPMFYGAVTIAAASASAAAGWFWPFGLITPLVIGIGSAIGVRRCIRRARPQARWRQVDRRQKYAGLLLGSGAGVFVAGALWLVVLLVSSISPRPGPSESTAGMRSDWLSDLALTANRGFVRHLPILGPAGDELEALMLILNAPPRARQHLANRSYWQELAALPEMRDTLADQSLLDEIDRIRCGNPVALYRLQQHPRIIALAKSRALHRLIAGLRPSSLAKQLQAGTR